MNLIYSTSLPDLFLLQYNVHPFLRTLYIKFWNLASVVFIWKSKMFAFIYFNILNINSASNYDKGLICEHLFCKYFVHCSVGHATKGINIYADWDVLCSAFTIHLIIEHQFHKYFVHLSISWATKEINYI